MIQTAARFEAVPCGACGGEDQRRLYTFSFYGEDAGIVRCGDCGLAYTSPRPLPSALSQFYGTTYYSFRTPHRAAPDVPTSFKERVRRTILMRHFGYAGLAQDALALPNFLTALLARFLVMPIFQPGGTLLDVGCGSGERMLELETFGWSTRGLELSESAANAGRSAGLHIEIGELDNCQIAAESASTITFYHSLEHVYSPKQALRAAYNILKPGGNLLIAVPNFGCSERKLFGKRWGWLQMPTHLFHFDRNLLERLVRDSGFTDIRTRYSFHGESVDTERCGRLRPLADLVLTFSAVIAAFLGDGKALTITALKPS